MSELTNDETKRYMRHFPLQEVGIAGQIKLKNARVLCVGAGGLGSPLLHYLTAAGVGTIGIMDHDRVDISNLQRQTLFNMTHIGINKAEAAAEILKKFNPLVNFEVYAEKLDVGNALNIIKNYNIVADCTDSAAAKYIANDACFHLKKPLVYASISQFEGLCSILCGNDYPCYRCLFPTPAPSSIIKNCADSGILGTTAGILGVIQANEVIKFILNIGNNLAGRLLCFNTLNLEIDILTTKQKNDCILCAKHTPFEIIQHIEEICMTETNTDPNQISATELKLLIENNRIFLIDVRENYEHEISNIGGVNIPLATLPHHLDQLPSQIPIVTYCQAGIRSLSALQILKNAGFINVKSLTGGMNHWGNQ